jgi:hypothetical protein
VYCGGELVDALLRSGAHAYVEFKAVEANASRARRALRAVPGSRADVFTSRELSAADKRALMRALKAAAEQPQAPGSPFADGGALFCDALAAAGLSEELRGVVLHALALCDDARASTAHGVAALQRCVRRCCGVARAAASTAHELTRECARGALLCLVCGAAGHAAICRPWGAMARRARFWCRCTACRSCRRRSAAPRCARTHHSVCLGMHARLSHTARAAQAVAGALYVLRRDVDAILLEREGDAAGGGASRVCAVRTAAGQTLSCGALAAGAAYWDALSASGRASPPRRARVHRAAAVTDAPLRVRRGNGGGDAGAADADATPFSQLLAVLPPGCLPGGGPPAAVRLLQYGPAACVTPEGRHLVHLSTPAGCDSAAAVADAVAAGGDGGDDGACGGCEAQRALWPALSELLDTGGDAASAAAAAGEDAVAGATSAPRPKLRWAVFYSQQLDEARADVSMRRVRCAPVRS